MARAPGARGHGAHRRRRGHAQQRHRARPGPAHGADAPASHGLRPHPAGARHARRPGRRGRRGRGPLGRRRRPRRALRPARRVLLRGRLHAAAQAAHRAQRRAGRGGRRLPRPHRLGGDRRGLVRRDPLSLRAHPGLVAAALVGAHAGARRRLPVLGHPHPAHPLRRRGDPPAHRRVRRRAHGGAGGSAGRRPLRRRVRGRHGRRRPCCSGRSRCACSGGRPPAPPGRSSR